MPVGDPQLAVARREQNAPVVGGDRCHHARATAIGRANSWTDIFESLEELYDSRAELWERFPSKILPTIVDLFRDIICTSG